MMGRRGVAWFIIVTIVTMLILCESGVALNNIADEIVTSSVMSDRSIVIIDAGHGGVDGGAVSCTGAHEAHINLQIALKLQDLLHLLGIKTHMIRTEDISIYTSGESIAAKKVSDLKERVRIINSMDNAVVISIHQNYFEDSRYSGAQVFYNDPHYDLAVQLQNGFAATINIGSNRKVKKAKGIYLMDHIHCPAVLIECGFLSNPQEEYKLKTNKYQIDVCAVIACTVSCYIHNNLTAGGMLDIM